MWNDATDGADDGDDDDYDDDAGDDGVDDHILHCRMSESIRPFIQTESASKTRTCRMSGSADMRAHIDMNIMVKMQVQTCSKANGVLTQQAKLIILLGGRMRCYHILRVPSY